MVEERGRIEFMMAVARARDVLLYHSLYAHVPMCVEGMK